MADTVSIHREMFEAIQRRDFDRMRELYHPDYAYEAADGTSGGIDAGIAIAETYLSAFADLTFEVRSELACGDDASVMELIVRGTHTGELDGIPATGRSIEMLLCNVIEVRDGKVLRERDYFDTMSLLRQLGVADGQSGDIDLESSGIETRRFDAPSERRTPDKTIVDVVDLGAVKLSRGTLQPGWRWSECLKPIAGTERCEVRHIGAVISGKLHVVHGDGSEADLSAGSAYVVRPGHEAWVVGDEPFITVEFEPNAVDTFARPAGS